MYYKLFLNLNEDTVVLTANRRLSRYLFKEYAQYQIKKGKKTWSTPHILPLTTWLSDFWQHCPQAEGILLTDFQEQLLWQKIVPFLDKTVFLVKKAWTLMKEWRLSFHELEFEANNEVQCFISWALQFQKELKKNHWVHYAELPERLQSLIPYLTLPKQIILVGFDEFTPTIWQLFTEFQKKIVLPIWYFDKNKNLRANINHHYSQISNFSNSGIVVQRINFQNSEDEIQMMSRWAYAQWKENPNQEICCVIPDLTQRRSQVLRLFLEVFGNNRNFNISAAEPLTKIPLIKTALIFLELNPSNIDISQLSVIFRSSYINSSIVDICLSAELDVKLREAGQWQSSPTFILYILNKLQSHFQETTLTTRYQTWLNTKCSRNSLHLSTWTQQFNDELIAIGWPGQRSLNSEEYQQWKRWEHLLYEFSALDTIVIQPQTRKNALKLLRQLACHTLFQPQSIQEKPIHLLGLLETVGHYFDKLWIAGLNDRNWPAPASPNPFLPFGLQRRYQMPHASAKREMNYTLHLQNRLLKSAPSIILSTPLKEEDVQLSPSPLIRHFQEININELLVSSYQPLKMYLLKIKMMENIYDTHAPPLQENESITVGSRVLQSQSTCPFQAFAKTRLQAIPLNKPHIGLNGMDRGNFVHQVLDLFWKKIKDWKTLTSCSNEELENNLNEIIRSLFNREKRLQILFFRVEEKRLKILIKKWLLVEKNRPSFEVTQRETNRQIKIGQFQFKVRIDRIDNNNFIIDYKTGSKNSVRDWFGDRLKNIQLPLYCAYAGQDINGIAYAEVRSQKMAFKGLINTTEKINLFSEVKAYPLPWKELIQRWKIQLHRLAIDFSLGKADVCPIDPKTTCNICQLHSLCRIEETK